LEGNLVSLAYFSFKNVGALPLKLVGPCALYDLKITGGEEEE